MDSDQTNYRRNRFDPASRFLKYISRFQMDSDVIQDLVQNNPVPIYSEVVDLSVAQTVDNPKVIRVPGRAIVIYGLTTATKYDPGANTGIETVVTTAMVFARFSRESRDFTAGIPLKHNRGFRGDFSEVYLSWPAQSSNSARIQIYKFDAHPWQNGEAAT